MLEFIARSAAASGAGDVAAIRELATRADESGSAEVDTALRRGQFDVGSVGFGSVDAVDVAAAAESLAYGDAGVALAAVATWQAHILAGETATPGRLESVLLYEGFSRSPSRFRTRALHTSAGWQISGRKESVVHPTTADSFVVVARASESDGGASDGLGVFRVPATSAGLRVERDDTIERQLGLRAAPMGAIRLDSVHATRLDDAAAEPMLVHRRIARCRALLAAVELGLARASLQYAVEWAKSRMAFGQPIASYQGVSFVLADLATAVDAVKLNLVDTLMQIDELTSVDDVEQRIGRLVARAGALATSAGREAVNILGVHGIVTEHPVERWYRSCAPLSVIDFDPTTVALEIA